MLQPIKENIVFIVAVLLTILIAIAILYHTAPEGNLLPDVYSVM
jgi:hypothetical protein